MNSKILKNIGKKIREIRKNKELSQEKLGELCDLSRNFIGTIERGEVNAPILTLRKIAKALEAELNEFLQS